MNILVLGRNGQVANALAGSAGPSVTVTTLGRPHVDITDPSSIARAIAASRYDIVVNAAAYTAVDKAENDAAAAFAINRDGAGHAARAAAEAGLPIVHLSTDYVFPGDKPGPYVETDATGPTGVYGHSKLAGEEAVAGANSAHVILRTAWVYSGYGHNFLKTMLRLAADRDEVSVVADQHGTPTCAADIAAGIIAVAASVTAKPTDPALHGVFHMVAGGEATWARFAEEIFAASADLGGPTARVRPIATSDYPTPARRPHNSRLDTTRFGQTFHHAFPLWATSVRTCVAAYLAQTR